MILIILKQGFISNNIFDTHLQVVQIKKFGLLKIIRIRLYQTRINNSNNIMF